MRYLFLRLCREEKGEDTVELLLLTAVICLAMVAILPGIADKVILRIAHDVAAQYAR